MQTEVPVKVRDTMTVNELGVWACDVWLGSRGISA